MNCLLVDNDHDDCDTFFKALQEIDPVIHCETTNAGITATENIQSNPFFSPSLFFIDLNMSLTRGKQCLQQLKKTERLKTVPICVYSTSADPRTVEEVKASGATDFILKPSSFTQLVYLLFDLFKAQKLL
jgi:DNA-binding NtrC family response regulator